jgi:hypothetical protein
VRQVIVGFTRAEPPSEREIRDRAIRAAGRFGSGAHDTSRHHDEALADAHPARQEHVGHSFNRDGLEDGEATAGQASDPLRLKGYVMRRPASRCYANNCKSLNSRQFGPLDTSRTPG